VEVIIMGRPTKSRSLYAQMVGRATRPLPGVVDGPETAEDRRAAIAASPKASCLVVDFVGNAGRHKLMTSADILGGKVSDEAIAEATRRARETGKPVRMDEALDEAEHDIQERRRLEAARRARLVVGAHWKAQAVDPFDLFQIEPAKARGWDDKKALSEKQRGLLLRQGIDPDSMPYAHAKQLINELFRRWDGKLCTMRQAKILKRFGYDTNVTMDQASKLIDGLAKNGWRRPVVHEEVLV
jgi:type I site-specific restriction endonuclease